MATDHDIREIEKNRLAALLDWAFESDGPAAQRPDSNAQASDIQPPNATDETD
jgi:hypothetical protein